MLIEFIIKFDILFADRIEMFVQHDSIKKKNMFRVKLSRYNI